MPQWQGKSAVFLFIKKSIHANILSHIQKIAKTESERETDFSCLTQHFNRLLSASLFPFHKFFMEVSLSLTKEDICPPIVCVKNFTWLHVE